jgi:pyruvate dehydrogenase E2 component (dihydrolipoamide acetyltransferase)
MPSLGADMEQGILLEWLVKPGDAVHRGDIVAVVETPKSAVEVETFDDGTVQQLLVEEGQTVPVGAPLAMIGEASVTEAAAPSPLAVAPEPVSAAPAPVAPPAAGEAAPVVPVPAAAHAPSPVLRHRARELGVDLAHLRGTGPGGSVTRHDVEHAVDQGVPSGRRRARGHPATATGRPGRQRVSPLARRLAAEKGIDLATLTGSGPGGSIRADDVRDAVATRLAGGAYAPSSNGTPAPSSNGHPGTPAVVVAPPSEGAPGTSSRAAVPPHGGAAPDMRTSIAALMSRSNREVPHYYLSSTIDLHEALRWMRERNRELEVADRLVPAALVLAATARAARQVPELNGHWVDGGFVAATEVRLGFIVSLRGGGLLVPAMGAADTLSVVETMAGIRDLTRRARAGRLRASELAEPSITVSNLGEQGVESVHGVIYPPQVALVGFGAVVERPWAVDGLIGVRPLVTATLAGDHRATDGATGSRLLKAIDALLQRPEEL